MMKNVDKPIRDERITRETNALTAKLLPLMLILQAIVLLAKLLLGGWRYCLLDAIALAVGGGLAVILLTVKGVWRAGDEALQEIRNTCLSGAFAAMFAVLIFGEFICVMVDGAHLAWYAPTVLVWFVPALILTVTLIRRGLYHWGGKTAAVNGQKRLAVSTAVGAMFFGIVVGGEKCFVDGAFEPKGLLTVLGMAASWGVLFYLVMSLMLKIGGKQADKAVAEAEGSDADETENP